MSHRRGVKASIVSRGFSCLIACVVLAAPVSLSAKSDFKQLLRFAGNEVTFSALAPDKPVALVVLKRGDCPVCRGLIKRLATLQPEIMQAGGAVIVVLWDKDSKGISLKQKSFLGLPLVRASKAFLSQFEFWDHRTRKVMPGILFLDRCGEPSFVIEGRSPRRGEQATVLKTLRYLADQPSECGMML